MQEGEGPVAGGSQQPQGAGDPEPRVALTERRWSWFLRFCSLTDEDLALLQDAGFLAELSGEVAAGFYDRVFDYPELRALIESTSTVERHRAKLQEYFKSLFTGRFDDARLRDITTIGRAHDRIGLPLIFYLGATLWMDDVIVPAMVERYHNDPQALSRALVAYRKLVMCDLTIVTQTFIDAREQTTSELTGRLGLTVSKRRALSGA